MAVIEALVDQRPVDALCPRDSQYIDTVAPYRGWGCMETTDTQGIQQKRSIHAPPWLFPRGNADLPGDNFKAGPVNSEFGPKVAVFAMDPRMMMWQEYEF